MLHATLLQSCLPSQSSSSAGSKATQNPHSSKKPMADSVEIYNCLGNLQGKEKASHPSYLQVGSNHPAKQKEQEMNELPGKESWRANENLPLPFQRDGIGLASEDGCPVTKDSPRQASGLLHSAFGKPGDQGQEWKVVKVKRVLISPVGEPRKPNISRSASLSEKELKEAKARSQRIAAQLTTPPNPNSKGVLLFHRRKQRVNAFTLETPKATDRELPAADSTCRAVTQHQNIPSYGKESHWKHILRDNRGLKGSLPGTKDPGLWGQKSTMENLPGLDNMQDTQRNTIKSEESLSTMNPTLSSEETSLEEFQQIPLSVYLKENTGMASTNGMHELFTNEIGKAPDNQHTPVISNIENIPPIIDDFAVPATDSENNSTILGKELYVPQADSENNVLAKEPYLPVIDSEKNSHIPIEESYVPITDRENNIILEKLGSETVLDGKENGEIIRKDQDVAIVAIENAFPITNSEKPILITDLQPSETQTHTTNKQYCEVRLTLSKPNPVKNRTARPFGTQSLVATHTPEEKSPVVECPPPPTYAETFSSPPPVTRVRSPPAYSALYPSEEQKVPAPQEVECEDSRPGPLPGENREPPPAKTGILEESVARRSTKKSMFTFVEKPKVAPNPDLLHLVQRADSRKKQKGQGGAIAEDEPFALGAEASNFLSEIRAVDGPLQAPADNNNAPEWSSCLRSPRIQPKAKIKSNQGLSEARGKGAELFAKRQSRMQKYVVESPSQPDITRSPSPTISLPPSWKYASENHLSPIAFPQPPPRSPARSPKVSHVPLYHNNMSESELSKKELEISKQQPYQTQSSLFILSPVKDPVRSLPKAAPPPKPVVPELSYMRQASCPTYPLPPSPILHPSAQSSPSTSFPSYFGPSAGTMLMPQNIRTSIEMSPEPSFEYSSRIMSPRAKGVFQAPRPSYSTRNAGIEPQERKTSLPASPTWTPRVLRRQTSSLDGWVSPAPPSEPEEGLLDAFRTASITTPPPPMSPSWSERSLSPFRQETDPKSSRQMQVLLARNIINAARRKSSSPKATRVESFRPFTPPATSANMPSSCGSPKSVGNHSPSPLQSPRPVRMEGYRRVSLPVSTAPPPISASSNNSPRLLGSQSPTYKSPLQSPKAVRMNGNKYFTLPANTGASLFNAATSNNGPRAVGPHSFSHRDPKHTILDSHRIFTAPANMSRKSCPSPKNVDACSPTITSPLQSPRVTTHSPVKRYTSLSPTNSDISLDSEDSGIKSPSIRSFNICPRGWNGSLRLKRGSLPAEAPCSS
ncbi:synaptopodin [Anolis sagrei]|uniref:synaptopodin n=1 Tax=Anolis sagrei TaxID=38937 RepID=UPI0035205DEF